MTFSRSINLDQAVIHGPEVRKVVRPRMDDQSIRRAHSLDLGGRRRAYRQDGVGRALHCKRNMTPTTFNQVGCGSPPAAVLVVVAPRLATMALKRVPQPTGPALVTVAVQLAQSARAF